MNTTMKTRFLTAIIILTFVMTSRAIDPEIPDSISKKCSVVSLKGQQIDGYLGHWIDDVIQHELLGFPLEDYLWSYYAGGITNGVWGPDEFVGKYMHALTFAYQYKYQKDTWGFRQVKYRMDAILAAWLQYQKEDGYLFVATSIESERWEEANTVWMSKYVLLGLLKHYELFGYRPALDAAKKLGDNFISYYGPGGKSLKGLDPVMLESMVQLYKFSGAQSYLDCCQWMMSSYMEPEIVYELVFRSGRVDEFPIKHAYAVTSMLISILDLYQLEGKNPDYLKACEIAVEDMVKNRMYITGGMGQTEHFRDDHNLSCTSADDAQEACAVAHFIYLCRNLFYITGDPKYINYIEKGLYNNGLGSKNPQNTFLTSYFSPLQGFKKWKETTHLNGTPCCSASMARELVRIMEILWTKFIAGGIGVLLYNEASFTDTIINNNGENVPLKMEMHTDFPLSGKVILTLNPENPSVFPLKLRVPDWTNRYSVQSGDKEFRGEKGQFLTIEKRWKKGDSLIINMEMSEQVLDGGESFPGHIAFQRGPQILAVDSKLNPAFGNLQNIRTDVKQYPQLENANSNILPEKWWGKQVYHSGFLHNDSVFLVPYAEAGQMSAHDKIRTWIRVDDGWTDVDDDQFSYTGDGWNIKRDAEGHYGGSLHTTSIKGDYAELNFDGTGIELYVCAYNNKYTSCYQVCQIEVFIDGEYKGEYFYEELHHQKRLFVFENLEPVKHTIKLVCKDEHVFVDYARVKGM